MMLRCVVVHVSLSAACAHIGWSFPQRNFSNVFVGNSMLDCYHCIFSGWALLCRFCWFVL